MPVLYIAGRTFVPLSYLVFAVLLVNFRRNNQDHHIILSFLIVLVFGDSRESEVEFTKQLRVISLMIMAGLTIIDLTKKKYGFKRLFLLVIPFYVIAIIGAFRNYSFGTSFSKATSYILLLFVGFHYLDYHIRKDGKTLLRDVFYLAVIVFAVGLAFMIVKPNLAIYGESGRFRGVMGNPNGIGIYGTLLMMIFFLYLQLLKMEKDRIWIWAFWSVLLVSVVLSFSRNALLSISLFLFFYYFYKGGSIKRIIFYILLVPTAVALFNIESIIHLIRLMGLGEELRIESILTGSGRFFAWQWAWETFQENMWLGRGFAFEEILFHDYMPEWLIISGHQGGVHNSYLAFLLNTGIVGTILILFIFMRFLNKVPVRNIRLAILFSAGFSAFFEPWLNSSLNAFTANLILAILFYTHLYPPKTPAELTAQTE